MQNEMIQALLNRRTIRGFLEKPLSEEDLSTILECGRYAPSALGKQARFFTVIENQAFMKEIVDATLKNGGHFVPGHEPFFDAPVLIVLSSPEESRYGREDAALAAENILLAAHALGLGACYLGSVVPGLRDPQVQPRLSLPEGHLPRGIIALGYPKEPAPAPKARRTDDTAFIR